MPNCEKIFDKCDYLIQFFYQITLYYFGIKEI